MTTRRDLTAALGVSALIPPFASFAQQAAKVWRVGYVVNRLTQTDSNSSVNTTFLEAMKELGYVEGKNLIVERRSADNRMDRHPDLARELVKLNVDVIVTTSAQSTAAAQKATASIPIVMVNVGDPVGGGFVKSLSRPGGNITGLSSLTQELGQKQLDLLLGVTSRVMRVAVLVDPTNSVHAAILRSVREATRGTAVSILPVEARTGEEIAEAMSQASREKAGAILVNGGLFNGYRREIADLAIKYRLASISASSGFGRDGGLMNYGQNTAEQYRRAAVYVDKLFKGMKPADLPIEQPTKFELVINMKTAKALGITIPQSILVRADRVIE